MQASLKTSAAVRVWGNGLGVRLTKPVVEGSGVTEDAPVSITVQMGRIIIEPLQRKPHLSSMLAAFNPQRYGSEAMACASLGKEALLSWWHASCLRPSAQTLPGSTMTHMLGARCSGATLAGYFSQDF